jgi:hypothetical protein
MRLHDNGTSTDEFFEAFVVVRLGSLPSGHRSTIEATSAAVWRNTHVMGPEQSR